MAKQVELEKNGNRGIDEIGSGDLREEVGDVKALSDESEKALESFTLLGIELAVEERGDVHVFGIVVEVRVGADPEHRRRRLAQGFRRCSELREHHLLVSRNGITSTVFFWSV